MPGHGQVAAWARRLDLTTLQLDHVFWCSQTRHYLFSRPRPQSLGSPLLPGVSWLQPLVAVLAFGFRAKRLDVFLAEPPLGHLCPKQMDQPSLPPWPTGGSAGAKLPASSCLQALPGHLQQTPISSASKPTQLSPFFLLDSGFELSAHPNAQVQ